MAHKALSSGKDPREACLEVLPSSPSLPPNDSHKDISPAPMKLSFYTSVISKNSC